MKNKKIKILAALVDRWRFRMGITKTKNFRVKPGGMGSNSGSTGQSGRHNIAGIPFTFLNSYKKASIDLITNNIFLSLNAIWQIMMHFVQRCLQKRLILDFTDYHNGVTDDSVICLKLTFIIILFFFYYFD